MGFAKDCAKFRGFFWLNSNERRTNRLDRFFHSFSNPSIRQGPRSRALLGLLQAAVGRAQKATPKGIGSRLPFGYTENVPKKRLIMLAVLVVAVAVSGLCWLLRPPPEPVYQGRRLSEWLDDYNRYDTEWLGNTYETTFHKPALTSKAIRAMGTASLPFLLAHVRAHTHFEAILNSLLSKQRLIKFRLHHEDPYANPSILALGTLGPIACPVLPELQKQAERSVAFFDVPFLAMVAIGTNALPTLESLCKSDDPGVRGSAAECIALLEERRNPTIVVSHPSAYSEPPGTRRILQLGFKGLSRASHLVDLLQNTNMAVRRASADAFAERGLLPMGRTLDKSVAIPALLAAINDPDPQARQSAAAALKAIDPIAAAKAGVK